MRTTLNFNHEFDELYNSYHNSDKGRKLLEIEGISRDKLDIAEMSRQYFTRHVSDVSIDGNANANEEISVNNYASEITKGILKLEGYFLLWHYAKKRYGKERADELIQSIWDGDVYFHDASGPAVQQPYCFSYSTAVLMTEGRPYGQLQSLPPKRADSFVAQVIECTMDMSQDFAGAITPADLIVNYAWYAKKEQLDDYRILNDLQKFVHVINNKFRVGAQSPFVNISLFDKPNLEKVFADYRYPDGSEVDADQVMRIQKMFGEWFAKGDVVTGLPYRFPVVTLNFTRDDDMRIIDTDFLDWASEHNREKGCFNLYVNDGTKLASCCRLVNDQARMQYRTDSFGNGGLNIGCYDEKTEVLTGEGWKFFRDVTKDDTICTLNPDTRNIEYHKPTATMQGDYSGEMHHYKHQSLDLLVTPNHNMAVVSRKTGEMKLVESQNLGTGYNLPRNGSTICRENADKIKIGGTEYNCNSFMSFLGFYLGDGSIFHEPAEAKYRAYEIGFCVQKSRKINAIREMLTNLGVKFSEYKNRDGIKFAFYNKEISEYLAPLGKAKQKHIPREVLQNYGFENLTHLLDGLIETDGTRGTNGTWFYTSSKQLKDDVVELCAMLGVMTNSNFRKRLTTMPDGREVEGECYEIHLLQNERLTRLSKYRNVVQYDGTIYCLEVPNHIMMVRRNGTVAWCGNSHRVVTINLPRLALDAKGKTDKFFDYLTEELKVVRDLLLVHREEILKRRIESGLLKFYKPLEWFNLSHLFSTIGIIGVYEMVDFMGLDIKTEQGQEFVEDVLLHIEQYAVRFSEENKCSFNVEEIPGESTAPRFAKKDRLQYRNQPFELYSNQYIPLIADASMPERVKLTGRFMDLLSGGGILHLNIKEVIQDRATMRKLIEYAVKNGVSHLAINYGYGICENGHTSVVGTSRVCPVCGGEISEWMTRIIGYFTRTSSWNEVRREFEYERRKFE